MKKCRKCAIFYEGNVCPECIRSKKVILKLVPKPLPPKISKIIIAPKDKIVSPPKFKTRQAGVKQHFRLGDIKVRKHQRTVRKR